ncbi:transmembrane protein 177-like [Pelobates fuscus]|uniref:transmembrane protein 177-like n=1 Tax=Pelobates fuscus TaxID=191477 RepID=UPI002FE4A851
MASPFISRLLVFTQRYRGRLLAISCAGLFTASISYHVFPEQTFRRLYQSWSKGEPVELSNKLQTLFQDVLQEACIASPSGYKPFAAFGFHPVSAGLPLLPGRCLIGIPANYNTNEAGGPGIVDRVLLVNGKEVVWDSEIGAHLKDSLILSTEAQKFALAREAFYAQNYSPVIKASVAPACLSGVCLFGVAVKQLLGIYSGPVVLRGLFNMGALLLGFVVYFLCNDAISQWLDYRTDRQVAAISKSYAQGGLEFYDKILARNRSLRTLMGKQGETMYAPSGNLFPKHYFRVKHTPYTARRHRIQQDLNIQGE